MQHIIRKITEADLPRLAHLEGGDGEGSDGESSDGLHRLIKSDAFWGMLAEGDAKADAYAEKQNAPPTMVLGMIYGWRFENLLEVIQITVHPDHRRQGLGLALLQHFINPESSQDTPCRDTPCQDTQCRLEVRAGNHAALGLYQKFGFVQDGTREGYYRDGLGMGRSDAVLMTYNPALKKSSS